MEAPQAGRRTVWLAAACSVALICVGLAWSRASPVGASPDDDFHLATVWCEAGYRDLCRRTGDELEDGIERVLVVPALGPGMVCFALQPEVSAGCQSEVENRSGLVQSRANDGLYPNGFYRFMALFASSNVERSVVVMRMISWLLAVVLLVAAGLLASRDLRRAFALAVATTLVPLGVFLFASTNPSGLAVAGVAAYWCAAYTFMTMGRDRRRLAAVVALLVVSCIVALASRSDAGLFLAVASLAAWVSAGGHRRELRRRSLLLLAVSVAGAGAALAARQSVRWAGELGAQEDRSFAATLFESALELPRRVVGSLGTMELGWLDTPLPPLVSVLMLLAFGGAVVLGMGATSREKWLALAVVVGTIVALPLSVLVSGQNVQARYVLPLLPVVVGTALLAPLAGPRVVVHRGQALLIVSAVVVAHGAALHRNIRRYVTGVDEGGPDLGEAAEWWWSSGPGPMVTWLFGSLAFALAAASAFLLVARNERAPR
jgi:hypothetical protein